MTGTATSSIRKFCIWSAVYILLIVSNRLACRSASTWLTESPAFSATASMAATSRWM